MNLPYRDKSVDVKLITFGNQTYNCYTNHYRFSNNTMVIIKTISEQFIPFGIYARKIINFLIAEYTYKKNYPGIYETDESQRMVFLGKKPVDFVEKMCGKRNVGSSSGKTILKQLEAILNSHMAIATGYRQMNQDDDELLAEDRFQFALIDRQNDEGLINHTFNLLDNWQEEIYVSEDLARILSQHIMPLDSSVYNQITSPMELDIYQYFTYQNYNNIKKNIDAINYYWEEMMRLFGRGYAANSQGMAHFRNDFRKSIAALKEKTQLEISAPLDSNQISFKPNKNLLHQKLPRLAVKEKNWKDIGYDSYKDIISTLPVVGHQRLSSSDNWTEVVHKYNLSSKFDNNALNFIKSEFEKNEHQTVKTIEYTLDQKPKNSSAFIKKALAENWLQKYEAFNQHLAQFKIIFHKLSQPQANECMKLANQAIEFLRARYSPEEFSLETLTLIYARLSVSSNIDVFLNELDGSKFKMYFQRHAELLIKII